MTLDAAPRVAAVRFHKIGKLYHFDASHYPDLKASDYVVVDTQRGRQLGQVISFVEADQVNMGEVKPIRRPANPRDLMMKKLWEAKEIAALIDTRETAARMGGLSGVKFVKASYNYDGSMLTILFTCEDNLDVTNLRKKLTRDLHTRVDLRRIGARDAARLLGEYGACGGPRCCSTFLTDFSPVSIKMAKTQGISLNPTEITGMCGRLRCCLVYEYEQYVEATKALPRMNKWVGTPHGDGKVIDLNPLKQTATVLVEEARYEVVKDDIVPLDELRALEAKAKAGCSREGQGGPCECGARVRSGKPAQPVQSLAKEVEPEPEHEIDGEPIELPTVDRSAAPGSQDAAEEARKRSRGRRRGGRRRGGGGGKPPTQNPA